MEVMPSEPRSLPDLVVGPCFGAVAVETRLMDVAGYTDSPLLQCVRCSWPSTTCLNRPSLRGVAFYWIASGHGSCKVFRGFIRGVEKLTSIADVSS